MKILHVAEVIQEACGVSCFVMEVAKAQAAAGHDVCIVTKTTCSYPIGNLKIIYTNTPQQIKFQPDIVHLHCIWNLYIHRMAVWCRKKHIPYVVSPHGTLMPWALKYKWWKKFPALLLYQYKDLLNACAFHTTAVQEKVTPAKLWLKQPVTIAPWGVDLPEKADFKKEKIILFVGRIHPIKGLAQLVSAFGQIPQDTRCRWKLVIAGPDDVDHKKDLKELAQKSGLSVTDFTENNLFAIKQSNGQKKNSVEEYKDKIHSEKADILFTGPVYGEAKQYMYQAASCFVLPSFSENFGGVVLEALAAGTPVLTTTGTPWKSLVENNCGWWVEPEAEAIQKALKKMLDLPEPDFNSMSENAKKFVKENFSWASSAAELVNGYCQILNKQ